MKYAIIFRKMELEDITYYQGIETVKGTINENGEFEIPTNDNLKTVNSYPAVLSENDLSNYAFMEIDEESYKNSPKNLRNYSFFLEVSNNKLKNIDAVYEKEKVKYAFYNLYHDFDLIPKFDLDKEIDDVKKSLKEKVKGQDEVIENILSKIYNNQIFLNSDLANNEIDKYKSNILIMGPHGTGKTLIKNTLVNSFQNIPIIEYELTGDINHDINEILQKLIINAGGNVSKAERGIVIFDSMKEKDEYYSEDGENLYLRELFNIIENKVLHSVETHEKLFDYSGVTNIVICNIDYQAGVKEEDNTYYSKINYDDLNVLGIEPHIIYDLFNEEIVYMNDMTYDLALSILKDRRISPLYKIKSVLKKNNKELKFGRGFIHKLIEQGLDLEEGFQGIIRILNYLTQKKSLQGNVIEFTVEDLDKLKVGTASMIDENTDYSKEEKQDTSTKLKVDIKKRTINGLTVNEVVKKITNKIKGQDEQTFRIVNSLYNQVMNRYKNFNREETKDLKSSVLLIGGPGTGKTAILEKLASIFDIPYVRADATRFSGTGIVGADVDDMLKELVQKCHGNKTEAENGILHIDEFDKLGANAGSKVDIGGDVQRALLTLLEGSKIQIQPSKNEIFSQTLTSSYEFDTTNLIIFASGAFDGIDKIVEKRVRKETNRLIGFQNETKKEINKGITPDDIREYGIDKQVSRRLPNVICLNNLDENTLLEIINSDEGFVNLSRKSYEYEGIKLNLSEKFKQSLAHKSALDEKGASSIKTIFSRLLDEIDMQRTTNDIEEVVLDENSLDNPKGITYVKKK